MDSNSLNPKSEELRYSFWLTVLLFLFCFRVSVQLIQYFFPVNFLPLFEAWHSGALPYWLLVMFQIVIILFCVKVIFSFRKGKVQPNQRLGMFYLFAGIMYFSVMLFRLGAGLTFASGHGWFSATIPSVFHLVLATFLILLGHFHFKFRGTERP